MRKNTSIVLDMYALVAATARLSIFNYKTYHTEVLVSRVVDRVPNRSWTNCIKANRGRENNYEKRFEFKLL